MIGRIRKIRKRYIVDVPPGKTEKFLSILKEIGLEAIEHTAEGSARGIKNG